MLRTLMKDARGGLIR